MRCSYFFIFFTLILLSVSTFGQTNKDTLMAVQALTPVVIDGSADDECWARTTWKPIGQVWIPYGVKMAAGDFEGKFKVAWDREYLYLLIEVVDDMLSDDHSNPLQNWWDDDCLEIFIDENRSMGDHERNANAFAYHISLTYDAVDLNSSGGGVNYKNNINVRMDTIGVNTYLWEVAIKNYSAAFNISNPEASRVYLTPNKLMGLTVAYCDNDQTNARENFIGSMTLSAATHNESYKNANYFGPLLLKGSTTGIDDLAGKQFSNQLVSVYPNPAENRLKIERKIKSAETLTVRILSVTGTLAKTVSLKGSQETIEISDLMPGMYVLNISSDKYIQSERIIKR
ncbi:MAG TPA: sugar-binding protein [Prolixibacteraceae bacterium]|nr:sugar-binding protein [Prolixibacteraceae bacterium]